MCADKGWSCDEFLVWKSVCAQIPKDSTIASAGTDAARNHVDKMKVANGNDKKIEDLGPVHAHVWAAISKVAGETVVKPEDAAALKEHFEAITKPGSDPHAIAMTVHLARFRKAWKCLMLCSSSSSRKKCGPVRWMGFTDVLPVCCVGLVGVPGRL